MTQAQFATLDALIVSRIGRDDQHALTIWAAIAIGIAQVNGGLTTSPQLQALATQVWG